MIRFFFIWVFLIFLSQAEKQFTLESRWPLGSGNDPREATLRLKSGSRTVLKCTSSEKFNLCNWARPNSENSCSIFGNDPSGSEKPCPSDDSWSIEKLSDDKTCQLTIKSVRDVDEGKWVCDLQSYPTNVENHYDSIQASTYINVIQPAKVELKGPAQIPVTMNSENHFTCIATGSPKPIKLEWVLGDVPLDIVDSQTSPDQNPNALQVTVSALVLKDWNAKQISCTSVQIDDEGNEVRSADTRIVRVIESRTNTGSRWGEGGEFEIIDRYPPGRKGEIPNILVAPDTTITFSCSSSISWDVCRWKRPNSNQPCGLLSYDISPKSCRQIWNDQSTSPSDWQLKNESPTKCSITGSSTHLLDAGEWNCNLLSKPISGEHSTYDSDQMHFNVRVIRPSRLVVVKFPSEVEALDGDEVEFSIEVTDADPSPSVAWFLNTVPVPVQIVEQTEPTLNSFGAISYRLTIRYTAHEEDTGKRLVCKSIQTDTEGREVVTSIDTLLTIKARPPPEKVAGMGVAVIAIIVSCGVFILLVLILLFVAFRTGRFCFKQPTQMVYIEKEPNRAEQGSMEVQTDGGHLTDVSIGADFGPDKPRRVDFRDEHEYEPLLNTQLPLQGADLSEMKKANKLSDNSVEDDTKEYNYEGDGSLATSLSSLNTDVSERDWAETFKALGPKVFGASSQESLESSDEDDSVDGTEV